MLKKLSPQKRNNKKITKIIIKLKMKRTKKNSMFLISLWNDKRKYFIVLVQQKITIKLQVQHK